MLLNRILSLFTSKPKLEEQKANKKIVPITPGMRGKHPAIPTGEPIYVKRGLLNEKVEVLTTKVLASNAALSYHEFVKRQIQIASGEIPIGGGDIGIARGIWEVADMIVDCKNFGYMSNLHFDTGLYTDEFIEALAREIAKECRKHSIRTIRWLAVTWDDGDENNKKYAYKLLMALEGDYLDHV